MARLIARSIRSWSDLVHSSISIRSYGAEPALSSC